MSVMKTSLTIIPMCPREPFSHYKKLFKIVLCYKKDWATLLHFIYFYLLLVTNYLFTKLSVTTYLLGNVAEIQNFLRITKIKLWSNLAMRGRRVHLHTLVDR